MVVSGSDVHSSVQTIGRHFCSADRQGLTVACTRPVRWGYGQRNFAVSGPATWNLLSRSAGDRSQLAAARFSNRLKAELLPRHGR